MLITAVWDVGLRMALGYLDPESPNSKFGKPLMGPCPSHSLDWVAVEELKVSYHPGYINICIYSQC